jgi:hypothetical protein
MNPLEEVKIFFFGTNKYCIGEIAIDAVIKETHELNAQISEHPTESGESFCDHVQNLPTTIQIEGIISNTPLTFVGVTAVKSAANFFKGESNDLAEQAFKKLEDIFAKREPITISTSLKEYKNMALESLSVDRSSTSESLHFSATAKQIRIVNQATIELPEPKVERARPKKHLGKQETKPVSEPVQKKLTEKKSLLNAIFSFGQ